jgi:hypothetical protein
MKLIRKVLDRIVVPRGRQANGVPKGLTQCRDCGGWRGRCRDDKGHVRQIDCICAGPVCPDCGERVHRPISDLYDPRDGKIWHQPYFGMMAHYSRCKGRARRRG